MAKYQNLKYDRWTLEHKRGQKFELVGRIVELPEEVGDMYPKLLKKIEEEKPMKKETVVTNENKVEPKEDEKVVLNVEEKPVEVKEEVVTEEPVKEKKTRKKSKN